MLTILLSLAQAAPPDIKEWRPSDELRRRELDAAELIERNIRKAFDGFLDSYTVAAAVRLNACSCDEYRQSSDEEKSFVLKVSEERDKETGRTAVRVEPHPAFFTQRLNYEVGRRIEFVSVSIVIAEDPKAPVSPELLQAYERIIRAAAGDDGSGRTRVSIVPIPRR